MSELKRNDVVKIRVGLHKGKLGTITTVSKWLGETRVGVRISGTQRVVSYSPSSVKLMVAQS